MGFILLKRVNSSEWVRGKGEGETKLEKIIGRKTGRSTVVVG